MTCIGISENATFIPDNFDHVLIAVDIMILPAIFVILIHLPGLFVAPATRGFCVAVKRLKGLEICSISAHQHSAALSMEYSLYQSISYVLLKMHIILQSAHGILWLLPSW